MFIILAGAGAGLSWSSTSRAGSWVSLSFSIQGRGRSLALRAGQTSITRGWPTAGVVSFSALGSPAWLPVPPPAARAVVASRAREDRPRRRALLGRRSCSGAGSRRSRRRRDHRHHPRFGHPALCTCPRPSSVGVGEGKVATASALRPSLLQFGRPEQGSLTLLLERATVSHPSVFCCSVGPPIVWGCS
jgi:hypothetical protein